MSQQLSIEKMLKRKSADVRAGEHFQSSKRQQKTTLDNNGKANNTITSSTTGHISPPAMSDAKPEQRLLCLQEVIGDLFSAPDNTVLIHACNCKGHWGAGIAAAFAKLYPNAYRIHNSYCVKTGQKSLPGTAQLVSPLDTTENGRKHFVGCLFTSRNFGRNSDSPAIILQNTNTAMRDLVKQVADWNERHDEKITQLWMCKINSERFKTPWTKTKEVLQRIEIPDDGHLSPTITVTIRE
ncbi:ADP-ribose 1''-phosphate phosphatase [Taxawa tesnikishii (nom. ined.)]|nr:ADP-ribose 1''-phosphate phosphatase [Dothideales sp. JES 119]